MHQRLHKHQDYIAVLLLAFILVTVFWSWLFEGKAFYWGDIGLYFQPMLHYLREEAQQGICPLWNPYIFCGTPYVGNPQTWIFYPSTALLALLAVPSYIMVNTVLHLLLAGVGFYYFLRYSKLTLGFWPSLMGAASYMLGGYMISKTQFPNMAQALAYVPLALLYSEWLIAQTHYGRAVTLGIILGLQILAAHAQITLFTIYLMLVYALWCYIDRPRQSRPHFKPILICGLLVLAIAVGLACVQLLPVAQLAQASGRQHLNPHQAPRFALSPQELTNFFWPYRFGSPMLANWNSPGNFWEKACYVGIVPCLLTLVGVLLVIIRKSQQRKDMVFWLFILMVSALLALGGETIFYPIAFMVLPGLNRFHDAARLLFGAAVAFPVLAAIGLQGLLESWKAVTQLTRRHLPVTGSTAVGFICLLLTCIDLGAYDRAFYPLKPISEIEALHQDSPFVQALAQDTDVMQQRGRIVLADPEANRTVLFGYESFQQDDPKLLTHWADLLVQNTNMPLGILQAAGYEPVALRSGLELRKTIESQLPLDKRSTPTGAAPKSKTSQPHPSTDYATLLGGLGGKYLVTFGPYSLTPTPGLTLLMQGDWQRKSHRVRIYYNHRFLPRARLYRGSLHSVQLATKPNSGAEAVKLTSGQPDQLTVRFSPASHPRSLLLTDTNYAGWTAFINGVPTPVLITNYQFRTVAIPPETNLAPTRQSRVTFVYQPVTFKMGLFITLLTLASLMCYWCLQRTAILVSNKGSSNLRR